MIIGTGVDDRDVVARDRDGQRIGTERAIFIGGGGRDRVVAGRRINVRGAGGVARERVGLSVAPVDEEVIVSAPGSLEDKESV